MNTIITNMKAWRIAPLPEPIGFTGDNMVTRLEVVTDLEEGWQLKLDIQKFGQANVIDLARDGSLFYVDLTADMLSFTGTATSQIRGLNGDQVAHSNQFDFTVRQSINAIDTFPPLEPTEMSQLEARVTAVKELAEGAKTAAEQSATQAKASETAAKGSETAAAASEATATQRASAAKLSEDAAKTSELAAKTHADNAGASATNAAISQTNAKDSELAAGASANAAGVSSTQSADSAAQAKQSATGAKQSETAAALSETNSKTSETAAKLSEANAKLSETNSKTSETNAKASETAAKTSETNAGQSASNATLSETNAKTSDTNAGTHANNASASAVTAQGAATEATTQAGNATTEADRAKTEADRAEGALVNNNLKLATIDKELSDYTKLMSQVNINQEAKQTVTGYDKILSLPKNAANGSAGFELEGLTAQNLVKNGDFSQGTTGWFTNFSTNTVVNNVLSNIGDGTFLEPKLVFFFKTIKDHKYYCTTTIRVTNDACNAFHWWGNGGRLSKYMSTPKQNEWYTYSEVYVCVDGSDKDSHSIGHTYADASTANGKVMEVKEVMAIDLTSLFGAGNEPDVATCDKMFVNWFDGMKSVQSRGRVKSVGKNLWGTIPTTGLISLVSYENERCISYLANRFAPNICLLKNKLKNNTQYTFSLKMATDSGRAGAIIYYSDETVDYLYAKSTTLQNYNFISNADKTIAEIRPSFNSGQRVYISIENSQIEEGVVATPYEPYISTSKYLNSTEPLRRVPNGVCDEILQRSDGGYELVQRVSGGVSVVSGTAIDTTNYPLAKNAGSFYIDLTAGGGQSGVVGTDSATGDGTVYYQLATPIITPIETSGTLLSYPSGTMFWENITADAGMYSNGITVFETGFPISSLETLSKVDFQTGIETALDISTAVIAPDGLSFTHPDLLNGDIVLFSYRFKDDAPEGNKTIDYYDSRYVVKDSVTGKFYQWGVSVADATPSFDLVEV